MHYNKETGQVTHGGVVNGPDHVYAGAMAISINNNGIGNR